MKTEKKRRNQVSTTTETLRVTTCTYRLCDLIDGVARPDGREGEVIRELSLMISLCGIIAVLDPIDLIPQNLVELDPVRISQCLGYTGFVVAETSPMLVWARWVARQIIDVEGVHDVRDAMAHGFTFVIARRNGIGTLNGRHFFFVVGNGKVLAFEGELLLIVFHIALYRVVCLFVV